MLLHQANRSLANFGRKSPLSGVCHHRSLSRVEASDKPGAVQRDTMNKPSGLMLAVCSKGCRPKSIAAPMIAWSDLFSGERP